MSLSKEIAHDLRTVSTQPKDLAVLPQWLRVLPIAFYAGFVFFLLSFAVNNFRANIYTARKNAMDEIIRQYQQMMDIDRQTTARLIEQRNAAVRVARWTDYSPMLQGILVGIFGSMDERVQITSMQLERKEGVRPEYALNLYFRAAQGDISAIMKNARDGLAERGWQLTTGAQVYQENVTNFQGYIQPIDSIMPLESQYLSVLQEQPRPMPVPTNSVSATMPPGTTTGGGK